jgi:DNA-binding NarL/FixJ family response regulator
MYEIPTAVVVDDNDLTMQVLCDYLAMINVNVLGRGHDGKDAVELYTKYKPDIVFLDLIMPNYDGFFALSKIRKQNPKSVVIVVTSDLSQETADKLDMLKPTKIIYKPFAAEAIAEVVEKIRKTRHK